MYQRPKKGTQYAGTYDRYMSQGTHWMDMRSQPNHPTPAVSGFPARL